MAVTSGRTGQFQRLSMRKMEIVRAPKVIHQAVFSLCLGCAGAAAGEVGMGLSIMVWILSLNTDAEWTSAIG